MRNWLNNIFPKPQKEPKKLANDESAKDTMITVEIDHIINNHYGMQILIEGNPVVEIRRISDSEIVVYTNVNKNDTDKQRPERKPEPQIRITD